MLSRAKRPVRIAFVIGSLEFGGAEKHLSMLVPALPRDRFAPEVHVLARKGELARPIEDAGVPVFVPPMVRKAGGGGALKILQLAMSACALAVRFAVRRPAIVHFFLPESYLVGAPLAVMTGRPVRLMSRRSLNDYQKKYPALVRIERRLHPLMTRVLGNSRKVVEQLVRQEGVPEDRCVLIYNGCDVDGWPADPASREGARRTARGEFGLSEDDLVFVIVANLIPYKGHVDLVRALALFAGDAKVSWKLLVAGRDDGAAAAVRDEARRLGVEDRLLLLGKVADMRPVLAASDVGILVSHQEGFSNAILEYMSARLPVIATDVGGNGEAVVDGETGFIVQPRDPASIAAAIGRLAGDAKMRHAFGEAGRARVEAMFSNARCISDYVSLYQELLRTGKER